jgi:integrase
MPADGLDRRLATYVQFLYDDEEPFTYAACAVSAVAHWRPDVADRLPIARQCLRGWERVRARAGLVRSHPPLTWEMTLLIACTLARSGHRAAGVATLLAFDCYLRVGELCRLRVCDMVMPDDARMGSSFTGMIVTLPRAKTGLNQAVKVQRQAVAAVLCDYMQFIYQTGCVDWRGCLFGLTGPRYRELLCAACTALGLPPRYTPHSLRHGGASHDYLLHGDVYRIMLHGRWASEKSVKRYIQTSAARLAAQEVPGHLHRAALALGADLPRSFSRACAMAPLVAARLAPHIRRRRPARPVV